jgi:hypothetical protein
MEHGLCSWILGRPVGRSGGRDRPNFSRLVVGLPENLGNGDLGSIKSLYMYKLNV